MSNSWLSSIGFDSGEVCDYYVFYGSDENVEDYGNQFSDATEWKDFDLFSSDFDFNNSTALDLIHSGPELFILDEAIHGHMPELQPPLAEPEPPPSTEENMSSQNHLSSYEAVKDGNQLQGEKLFEGSKNLTAVPCQRLSTEEVMRVAGACYIQSVEGSMTNPYGCMLSALTVEETQNIGLAHLLLSAAEKVDYEEFDRADRLLTCCKQLAAVNGNPTQRVVHHFAGALSRIIDLKTRKKSPTKVQEEQYLCGEDMAKKLCQPQPALIALHHRLPFSQLSHLTSVDAILDSVSCSTRIHLIDLGIRIGIQWIGLMQALSTRSTMPVELLRITAVGISEQTLTETGDRLAHFAKTMNLPFRFEGIVLPDLENWEEHMFPSQDSGESVVVYANMVLKTLLHKPKFLGNLMRMIKGLNPSLMVVTEIDAKHNSTSFTHQFVESLFFYSAWFDCLGDCMEDDDANRLDMEINFLSPGIWSIVAGDGENARAFNSISMEKWRSFFEQLGFVGVTLSEKLVYQASLIVKRFACGSSCTFDRKDNFLSVGWKGTPLLSVSAWQLG